MKAETGRYPMIGIIPDGLWKPGDDDANKPILDQLNSLIMPSILQECFEEGQQIKTLMHDTATWTMTRDREFIDNVGYVHDCPKCRESREGVVQYMLEHDDAWMFVAVVNYTAIVI